MSFLSEHRGFKTEVRLDEYLTALIIRLYVSKRILLIIHVAHPERAELRLRGYDLLAMEPESELK